MPKRITRKTTRRASAGRTSKAGASRKVQAVPQGLHTVTPHLSLKDCGKAIDFYKRAFGAKVVGKPAIAPDGESIWHAQLTLGDSAIFVNEWMDMGGGTYEKPNTSLWVYGPNVDARWRRAVQAGAKEAMPLADQFWGDRQGTLVDPWGVRWNLCERKKELTPAQMKAAGEEFVARMEEQQA